MFMPGILSEPLAAGLAGLAAAGGELAVPALPQPAASRAQAASSVIAVARRSR
jgi:hypothetical protein